MNKREPISDPKSELVVLMANGWELNETATAISKTYKFKSFKTAMAWMTRIAFEAEALNHHPEWSNAYATVEVKLTTHSENALTDLDRKLAERMDRFASS